MEREMMDFCYEDLGTSISTDGNINGDNFCLLNLLSSSKSKKQWMTEYFIKPPVKITLNFSHPIRLSQITFNCKVENQVSSIYEIYHLNESRLIAKSCVNSEQRKLNNTFLRSNASHGSAEEHFYLKETIKGIVFIIRKTLSSSNIPCVAHLQVWGRLHCSNDDYLRLKRVWLNLNSEQKSKCETQNNSLVFYGSESSESDNKFSNESAISIDKKEIKKDTNLPSEFLDGITFERMNIPMILPSGNVVDKSTLDRHIFEESKWGRAPSDPFTWKLFSERSKPIFDSSLKTRIDTYVLRDSMPTKRKFLGEEFLEQSHDFIQHIGEDCLNCGENHILYRMPCRHLICQACVQIFSKDIDCSKCSKSFPRSVLTRYHFVSNKRFCLKK
ncbi:RING finger protein 37 [Lepeophtheirus salmonis]|uniref:RING finger protein 37like [Hydra vulgaris] n=1 Tax=Lepeophtheirus salmonis TaxID=72036 RepID=A0A0K2UJ99_LEPSM|nr:RING finger protein 37-like [Lepeophtheirus salmonis]